MREMRGAQIEKIVIRDVVDARRQAPERLRAVDEVIEAPLIQRGVENACGEPRRHAGPTTSAYGALRRFANHSRIVVKYSGTNPCSDGISALLPTFASN